MGIYPDYPKLIVTVEVNVEKLEEFVYDEPGPSRHSITKYVEAKTESLFAVQIYVPQSLFARCGVRYSVRIDSEDMLMSRRKQPLKMIETALVLLAS